MQPDDTAFRLLAAKDFDGLGQLHATLLRNGQRPKRRILTPLRQFTVLARYLVYHARRIGTAAAKVRNNENRIESAALSARLRFVYDSVRTEGPAVPAGPVEYF